jgi:predicted MFS family arabinose efflux permease
MKVPDDTPAPLRRRRRESPMLYSNWVRLPIGPFIRGSIRSPITLTRRAPPSASEPTADAARLAPARGEWAILLTLAAVQLTHIVDFMMIMPLGPQFMRIFELGPGEFSLLVSVYTFAASASGFVAAFWIDRYDRKNALIAVYLGFIVSTALCGLANSYPLLLGARIVAGAFGGVLGALVLAIVADTIPYQRRATATAIVAASFSIASVAGVPLGLWIAAHLTWRAPFLALGAMCVVVAAIAYVVLKPVTAHLEHAQVRHPVEQLRLIFGEPNHLRAFAFVIMLMFAGFTVIPFIAAYNVANVGLAERELAILYFAGGLATLVTAQIFGRLADRYGKKRLFTILAVASIVPIAASTNLPRVPLAHAVAVSTIFFVIVTGRFGPAMALITGSAQPRVRGSFMSFNASLQQLGAGLAAMTSGLIIGRSADGALTNFGAVGWLAVACTLACIVLARRIRVVE